jgi:hypothetical protein
MQEKNTALPKYMLARPKAGGVIYYYSNIIVQGKRRELPLGPHLPSAIQQHSENVKLHYPHHGNFAKKPPELDYAKTLFASVKSNARTRNIYVDITVEDIEVMLERSGFRCELTDIHFDLQKKSRFRVRPWVPSVDRIDSSKPYTMNNCRVVCAAVNSAMNQYGEDVLMKIAMMMIEKKRRDAVRCKRGPVLTGVDAELKNQHLTH